MKQSRRKNVVLTDGVFWKKNACGDKKAKLVSIVPTSLVNACNTASEFATVKNNKNERSNFLNVVNEAACL